MSDRLTILTSKSVFTGTGDLPFEGFVAVRGNRIEAVGTKCEVASYLTQADEVVDLGDRTVMPGLIRGVSTCICSRISAAISSTRGRAKVCRIRAILGNGHRVSVIGASLLWGRTPHWGEKAPSRRVSFQRRFPNGGRGCTIYRKTNKNSVLY